MKCKHLKAYMKCAEAFAECSSSKRLSVGAVIIKNNNIIATGYNALPAHIDGSLEDDSGNTRPEVRHAEKNALLALVKSSESAVGATLIVTHGCCKFCAIDIVDAGIERVIYKEEYRITDGIQYLKDNGVMVVKYED